MKPGRAAEFRQSKDSNWMGDESAKELFCVWRILRNKCEKNNNEIRMEDNTAEDISENISEVERNNNKIGREDNALNSVIEIETNEMPEMEKAVENQELDTSHAPLEELQKTPPDNVNKSILQTVTTNKSRVSTSFLDHVLWPAETPEKLEKQRNRERLLHATISRRWLLYWKNKRNAKRKRKRKKKYYEQQKESENMI